MTDNSRNPFSRPQKPFFNLYSLAQIGFFLFGVPKNTFGSVDVTNDCNLRCGHCYFFAQDHSSQWSVEQWRDKFEQMKAQGFRFYQCTWVGGEPLLRMPLIEMGRQYFKYNTVTTNGTIPLPDWKDVSWYISVDGSRQFHDRMRNKPGLYAKIQQNISQTEGLKITIACCITSENFREVEAVLREWHGNPKVRSIVFSFYTPVRGLNDDLWLGWEDKDRTIELLRSLKREYGEFIVNSDRALRLMKSDTARSVTDRCPFAAKSFAFSPTGELKKPCMLGEKADCDRCGCVVPFYLRSLTDRKLVLRDLTASLLSPFRRHMARLFARRR